MEEIRKLVIESDSFGFEMRVRSLLNEIDGGEVEYGGTYSDPVVSVPRQFDLRLFSPDGNRALRLAIECKNHSPESPFLICGHNRTEKEAFHETIVTQDMGRLGPGDPGSFVNRCERDKSLYRQGDFVGKSIMRLAKKLTDKKGGDKKGGEKQESWEIQPDLDIYKGWAQALASTHELTERSTVYRGESHSSLQEHTMFIPITVVPDGALMNITYDESGEIVEGPVLVGGTTLFVDHEVKISTSFGSGRQLNCSLRLSHVHILTFSALASLCKQISEPYHMRADPINIWAKCFKGIPVETRPSA